MFFTQVFSHCTLSFPEGYDFFVFFPVPSAFFIFFFTALVGFFAIFCFSFWGVGGTGKIDRHSQVV